MRKKTFRNFFLINSIFSVVLILLFLQTSCTSTIPDSERVTSNIISLRKIPLQYGAYDYTMSTAFIKGSIHLNYINRNNYWEFGKWGKDSVNTVKFNGAFYRKFDKGWSLYSGYNSFDLPDYLTLVFPDKRVKLHTNIRFHPNPITVPSKNAVGKIEVGEQHFYGLTIKGNGYFVRMTLLRMLPLLPSHFQTKIIVTDLSTGDSKILYRRLKKLHPVMSAKGDTTVIRIQGFISKKLFKILTGRGTIHVYPVKFYKSPGDKTISLENNEKLYYNKRQRNFKILKIKGKGKNIILTLSEPANEKSVYGLFVENNFVALGKSVGMKIEFTEYVNSISSFIHAIISNGNIESKAHIISYKSPYNRR